ncbi:MAG: NAD(P)(+) transhydrogenase (Re/Si-specific) subunit beta [Verrucomicrobia bacterium]|nr:NAD(P)(+) transhydrogenase (Re/Si-specific) subunit beta [Verrucomicrobiota bacterium]MBU1908660.1 NAD(P)(+) transhydrogenase (Re/Si-specific) subunit beta [Verrucomicrobiota bacterium]
MNVEALSTYGYIAASILFISGLKMLSSPRTARRGNLLSAVGMLFAVVVTLAHHGLAYQWILMGAILGAAIGAVASYIVPMTNMPQMVAVFNGFGGLASLLVGWATYHMDRDVSRFTATATWLTVLIGGVTFSGSLVAYLKLSERFISGRPVRFRNQQWVNGLLLVVTLALGAAYIWAPASAPAYTALLAVIALSLVLGVLSVIPIGGADMPVIISLLNSYSGMAAAAAGFVIRNNVLIVAGALVGASGIILTAIMCKAMNRSLSNVLFSGFGAAGAAQGSEVKGEAHPISPEDAYLILEAARSVVIVPGYGMAVAQAQHAACELGEKLTRNGCEVKYAIHPVAGRMPGHMNVLLAEANVPYEQLAEPQDVNPLMSTVDVAMVIGANDVVNPAAREDPKSPIYGMPIINVDHARTVFVLKRSLAAGFAGVDNPLFFYPNTRMLFGDAKATLQALVAEFKAAAAA